MNQNENDKRREEIERKEALELMIQAVHAAPETFKAVDSSHVAEQIIKGAEEIFKFLHP